MQWNSYDATQQDAVRERLTRIRDEVDALLICDDKSLFWRLSRRRSGGFNKEGQYRLLRFMVRRGQSLSSVGLSLTPEAKRAVPNHQPIAELIPACNAALRRGELSARESPLRTQLQGTRVQHAQIRRNHDALHVITDFLTVSTPDAWFR